MNAIIDKIARRCRAGPPPQKVIYNEGMSKARAGATAAAIIIVIAAVWYALAHAIHLGGFAR